MQRELLIKSRQVGTHHSESQTWTNLVKDKWHVEHKLKQGVSLYEIRRTASVLFVSIAAGACITPPPTPAFHWEKTEPLPPPRVCSLRSGDALSAGKGNVEANFSITTESKKQKPVFIWQHSAKICWLFRNHLLQESKVVLRLAISRKK